MLPSVELVAELVDEMMLDKPLNWEATNYETTKLIAITHTIEQYERLHSDKDFDLMMISTIAYLMMENTQLWIELQVMRNR